MIRKSFFLVVFGLLGFLTLSLPDPFLSDIASLSTDQAYDGLPDADLRTIAEQEWEAGRKETALSILDYLIEENMGDAAGARVIREQYLDKIKADESAIGRFQAVAYGFATGKVDNMSNMVGSSVGDLIIYGDLRDLVREFVFEDETDEIVVALSAAGILTTFFPPAEGAITAAKALKKASVFSKPMTKQLKMRLKGFKDLGKAGKLARFNDNIMPFFDLAKQSKWAEFTTMVRYCQNLDQVKFLGKLTSLTRENGKKVGQILAVAGNQGMKTAGQAMDHLQKFGQKGMDQLYSILRKGPAGIRFIAVHPTFMARTLKNIKKGTPLGLNSLHDQWNQFVVKYGKMATMLKYVIAAALFMVAAIQFFSMRTSCVVAVSAVLVISVLAYKLNTGPMPVLTETSQAVQTAAGRVNLPSYNHKMTSILIVVILFNAIVYWGLYIWTTHKLRDIDQDQISPSNKLSLLENMDIYFDLPLYIGLGMTIFAFLLITLVQAETGRIFAYVSTLIGIGVAVYMRLIVLHKKKDALLRAMMLEAVKVEDR